MNARQLLILGAATAMLLLVALAASLLGRDPEPQARERLYPQLEERLNDITLVSVQLDAERTLTFARENGQWQVPEKDDYPANASQLRKLLLTLARTELVEAKTSNPEYYERLGVQDPSAGGEDTHLVRIEADSELLVEVIVGKAGAGGNSYVRRAGEAQSWQGSEWIDLPARTGAWLDAVLLDIPAERIVAVEVLGADGARLEVRKQDEGLVLSSGGETVAAKPAQLERVAGALRELAIEDVADGEDDDGRDWTSVRFVTEDGLTLALQTRKNDDKVLLRATAELAGESPSEALQKEAERLNSRFGGRTFVVPTYLHSRLSPALEELREAAG